MEHFVALLLTLQQYRGQHLQSLSCVLQGHAFFVGNDQSGRLLFALAIVFLSRWRAILDNFGWPCYWNHLYRRNSENILSVYTNSYYVYSYPTVYIIGVHTMCVYSNSQTPKGTNGNTAKVRSTTWMEEQPHIIIERIYAKEAAEPTWSEGVWKRAVSVWNSRWNYHGYNRRMSSLFT